jgi:ribosome modulation factor
MKRQKRDKWGRAHSNGYQASLGDKTKEQCPYQNTDAKSAWLAAGEKTLVREIWGYCDSTSQAILLPKLERLGIKFSVN